MTIPPIDHESILRNVRLPGGARLMTWDVNRRYSTGQHMIGYAFWRAGATEPLFVGDDCGCAPSDAIDSDRALVSLLGWIALKPGDTDADYFARYTAAQLEWCKSGEAEDLGMYHYDADCAGDAESHLVYREFEDGAVRLCVRSAVFAPQVFTDIESEA